MKWDWGEEKIWLNGKLLDKCKSGSSNCGRFLVTCSAWDTWHRLFGHSALIHRHTGGIAGGTWSRALTSSFYNEQRNVLAPVLLRPPRSREARRLSMSKWLWWGMDKMWKLPRISGPRAIYNPPPFVSLIVRQTWSQFLAKQSSIAVNFWTQVCHYGAHSSITNFPNQSTRRRARSERRASLGSSPDQMSPSRDLHPSDGFDYHPGGEWDGFIAGSHFSGGCGTSVPPGR